MNDPTDVVELWCDSPFREREWISHGFYGAWSPRRRLAVQGTGLDAARHGDHWFLHAATEPGAGNRVHVATAHPIAAAFDGYCVDPALHQASSSEAIGAFWAQRCDRRVNGNFAAAIIDTRQNRLHLRTDAFGFAPLYYRQMDEVVLFGTHPDFLIDAASDIDPVALLGLLNHGHLMGNRSLYHDIHRVPLGGALAFSPTTDTPEVTRFDLDCVGTGERVPGARDLEAMEELFRQAVTRCLELDYGEVLLPLSSGLDSRRVLGALLAAGRKPMGITMRILQKGNRDLDARFATEIAAALGLRHTVVEPPSIAEYVHDNDLRRRAMGAETPMHDWAMTLVRHYPSAPTMIFKGFLGDLLQESLQPWPGVFEDCRQDAMRLAEYYGVNRFRRLLNPSLDRPDEVAADVAAYLEPYAERRHLVDLAEMVLLHRRNTATGAQMLQPRHLEVRPFLDLDFMQALLDIDPRIKTDRAFRRGFVERHYPELARFGSSSDLDEPSTPARNERHADHRAHYIRHIARDLTFAEQRPRLRALLSVPGGALAAAARLAPSMTQRWHWAMWPLFEAGLHRERTAAVWRSM